MKKKFTADLPTISVNLPTILVQIRRGIWNKLRGFCAANELLLHQALEQALVEFMEKTSGLMVRVNHDSGGKDNLRVVDEKGKGLNDTSIHAFLKKDYDSGRISFPFSKGYSETDSFGWWLWSMDLANRESYVFLYFTDGERHKVIGKINT